MMSFAQPRSPALPCDPHHWVERGRQILQLEVLALQTVRTHLDERFAQAVARLVACRGAVVVSGMGKAGIVAKKLAASFSSTGTPAYFLHPAEAVHGDLGCIRSNDVVLLLSYSGETAEVTRLLPFLQQHAACTMAITSQPHSRLARQVDLALLLGQQSEACALGLAPTSSTTAMLALGDALALVVSEQRGFTREQFAKFHPAGSLGRQLTKVETVMRPLQDCRLADYAKTVRQVLIHAGRPGRRTGAIMLTDSNGRLAGIFTDSDLARLLERADESPLDQPVSNVMTCSYQTITRGRLLPDALRILAQFKISELPVVSDSGRPLGIIDITDVMATMADDLPSTDKDLGQPDCEEPGDWPLYASDANEPVNVFSLDDHRRRSDKQAP